MAFSKFYVFDLHTGKASHTYYDSFAEAAAVVDSLNASRTTMMLGLGFKANQLTDRYQVRGHK